MGTAHGLKLEFSLFSNRIGGEPELKTFASTSDMARHDRTDHKMKVYSCPMCPHSVHDYQDIRKLKAHFRMKHDKKTYTCEVCGETFKSTNGLGFLKTKF